MASQIALTHAYKPSDDVVAREIEGEIIIVPLVAGIGDMEDELFTLSDTGKAIWDKLDGERSLADVVAELSPELAAEDGAYCPPIPRGCTIGNQRGDRDAAALRTPQAGGGSPWRS